MAFYNKKQLAAKKYCVYIDGIKQQIHNVIEVNTDEGWVRVKRNLYAFFGVYKTTEEVKYGKIHLVIEEDEYEKTTEEITV